MKSFFKYILFLILLNVGFVSKAETIYPIQLYATMLPPYTNCISDYINDGMNRLKLTAVVRDMNNHSFNQVRVLIQVKEGNDIKYSATTYPAVLGHGSNMMHEISVKALNNIIIGNNNSGCLEEGAYEFVFQMFDAHNSTLPLSEPVSIYCYLSEPVPPVCIFPKEDDCIESSGQNSGVINFTWMDAVASNLSTKEYEFELLEDLSSNNGNSNILPMFGDDDIAGKKVISRRKIYNSNVYTFVNTATALQAGHKYYWHVRNITDSKQEYSNGAKKYSELSSFTFGNCAPEAPVEEPKKVEAIADILEIKNVETNSKNVSATITWGLKDDDGVESLKKFCKYKLYFTRKKETQEGEENTTVEASSENQESETEIVESDENSNVKNLDELTDEFIVNVDNVNTYTLTSIERMKLYDVRVEGFVCDENNEISEKTEKSEPKDFMIPQPESEECNTNIKEVECNSLVTLSVDEFFNANDDNVVVKVKELTAKNEETHVYSGRGIVTCTIFKEKLGLNVEFKDIKVNSDRHLCDGVINVVSSDENNLMMNLNDVAGKGRSASKAPEQKEVKNVENINDIKNENTNQVYRNNVVTNGNDLYAVSNSGTAKSVGTLEKNVTPSISSLDNEDGVIVFDVENDLKENNWTPYIDKGASPFLNKPIVDSYERMGGSYIVPWLSMVSGDTKWIKAKPKLNFGKSFKKQFADLNFYAKVGGNYYKLESEMLNDTTYNVKVFGSEANKSYPIYAMSKDKSKTFGRLNIYSMKNKEYKVKLVPVINMVQFDNSLEDYQNRLNKIFEPLGKKFVFEIDNKPFTDSDIKVSVDEYSDLSFLDDGLNTSEGNGIFANETKEMKLLRKLYHKNNGDDHKYDAYLFLIPKNTNYDIKGFMPRTYSVGYLFVGEPGANQTVKYNDIYTAAHELCHGVFGLEHVFAYEGVEKGGVKENLMDYSTADNRYPSKYFQWNNIENPSDYHFPFVDTPDDGEMANVVAKVVMSVLSSAASQAINVYLLKSEEKMKTGEILKNAMVSFVESTKLTSAGTTVANLLIKAIKCATGREWDLQVNLIPPKISSKFKSVDSDDCTLCSWCNEVVKEGLGLLYNTVFNKATKDKLDKKSPEEKKSLCKKIAEIFVDEFSLDYKYENLFSDIFSLMITPPSSIAAKTVCNSLGFCSDGTSKKGTNVPPVPGITKPEPTNTSTNTSTSTSTSTSTNTNSTVVTAPQKSATYFCKEDWWPKNGTLKKVGSNYEVKFWDVEYEEYTLAAKVENNKLQEIETIPSEISYVACNGLIHFQKIDAKDIFDIFTKVCYDWLKVPGKITYNYSESKELEDILFIKTVYPKQEMLSKYIDKNVLALWETRNTNQMKNGFPNINELYNGKKLDEVKREIMGVEKGSKTLKVNYDDLQIFIDNAVSSYSGLQTQLKAAIIATAHYLASVKSTVVSKENYIETSPYIYNGELDNSDSFDLNLYDNLLSEFLFKMERHIIEKDGGMNGSHSINNFRYYDPLSEEHTDKGLINVYNAQTLPNTFINLDVR